MNDPVFRNVVFLPGTIHAGFPSPASDYEERNLDINDLVVPHLTSSYFMRVSGTPWPEPVFIVTTSLSLIGQSPQLITELW